AEAITMQRFRVLRAEHDNSFIVHAEPVTPDCSQSGADSAQQHVSALSFVLAYAARRLGGEKGERAFVTLEATVHVEWFPWVLFFIFGDALRELARIALGRHVDAIRSRAADIEENELQCATNAAVAAGHVAEYVLL